MATDLRIHLTTVHADQYDMKSAVQAVKIHLMTDQAKQTEIDME